MDIGISYWFGYPSFPEERTSLIKQAGFSSVSLHWTNEYANITGDKYLIPKELEKKGIGISSLHLSFERSHLLWNPHKEGDFFQHEVLNAIDDAYSIGIKTIVMHSDGPILAGFNIKRRLESLYEYADKKNVLLCLENLQHEDNLDKILQIEEFKNIPICYDFGHANIRLSSVEYLDDPNIRYFHIHDNDGKKDLHNLPFSGTTNWEKALLMIRSYQNIPKILEVHGNLKNRNDAEAYLHKAKELAFIIQK